MQAVEFEATITNGVLHIPKQYKELQKNIKATFVVMYDDVKSKTPKQDINKELDVLFGNSRNTVQATMALATQTDEMMDDGIL